MGHIPIFYSCDNSYAACTAASIASVCYNTSAMIDFYIISENKGGVSNIARKQMLSLTQKFANCSITFLDVEIEKIFQGFPISHFSREAYSRFLIPTLKPELDKALYLDGDTIILGDIEELFLQDLQDYAVGAVIDGGLSRQAHFQCIKKLQLDTNHRYFNSGVLLINVQKWRELDITSKLLDLTRTYLEDIKLPDQDILNLYFNHNNYQRLPMKYDVIIPDKIFNYAEDIQHYQLSNAEISEAQIHPFLRHFCSVKPWKVNLNDLNDRQDRNFSDFWFFAAMTDFYPAMQIKFSANNTLKELQNTRCRKMTIKLFGLTLFKMLRTKNYLKIYLFKFLPFLSIKETHDN